MLCIVEKCEKQARSKKMCPMHYQRDRNNIPLIRDYDFLPCSEENCENKPGWTGLCTRHYKRSWRANLAKNKCSILGCSKGQSTLGLCYFHSLQERVAGNKAVKNGNKYLGTDGYIYVYDPGNPNSSPGSGNVAEHRKIMSEHIGRALKSKENVHHVNGNRADNRIENLELWSTSQPSGQRVEDKLEWCVSFLEDYGYEVRSL